MAASKSDAVYWRGN